MCVLHLPHSKHSRTLVSRLLFGSLGLDLPSQGLETGKRLLVGGGVGNCRESWLMHQSPGLFLPPFLWQRPILDPTARGHLSTLTMLLKGKTMLFPPALLIVTHQLFAVSFTLPSCFVSNLCGMCWSYFLPRGYFQMFLLHYPYFRPHVQLSLEQRGV